MIFYHYNSDYISIISTMGYYVILLLWVNLNDNLIMQVNSLILQYCTNLIAQTLSNTAKLGQYKVFIFKIS